MNNRKAPTDKRVEGKGRTAAVGRDLQAKIGEQLRAMHDNVIREGVPERFRALLERLDKAEKKD